MSRIIPFYLATSAIVALCIPAAAATLPGIGTFEGVAGVGSSNGVVADSPVGSTYVYVTTDGSAATAGYGLGDETNGSTLTTNDFTAATGAVLQYFFNYVTSDGAGFSDYAYAQLNDVATGLSISLFNARTTVAGDTVPGFGLPAIDPGTTLTPAATPIVAGGPAWSELGGSSGRCFDSGCGYTGWIGAEFTIETAGDYTLTFGVTNWNDTVFDSGLAIAGATVDGTVIIDPGVPAVPLPAAGFMLLAGIGAFGALRRRRNVAAI